MSAEAMALAWRCLGGRLLWRGRVRGLRGLIDRGFVIESEASNEGGALVFREQLTFDDGASERREWRITPGDDGLRLDADGVAPLAPGRIIGDTLAFDYRIRFGGITFAYHDRFWPRANGGTDNVGMARLFGLPVMTVQCRAEPDVR